MFKLTILTAFDKFLLNSVGPFYRRVAKQLIKTGNEAQGQEASDDRLVQSLIQVPHSGQTPNIGEAVFTAPNSVLVGNVVLQRNASVWYGATLRGDGNGIVVGKNSVIQDNVYIKGATNIDKNVYVGPNSSLDNCKVGQDAFIGMGSVIQKGANVEGVLAAGSIVKENTEIKQGEIWAGSPAKYLRDISPQELQILREYKLELVQLAQIHAEECGKNSRQILNDADNRLEYQTQSYEEAVLQKLAEMNFPLEQEDEEFIEHRVFMKDTVPKIDTENLENNPTPYEQDLSRFPENFQKYAEDTSIFDEAKRYFDENPEAKAEQFPKKAQLIEDEAWSKKY